MQRIPSSATVEVPQPLSVSMITELNEETVFKLIDRDAQMVVNFKKANKIDGRCRILFQRYCYLYGFIFFSQPGDYKLPSTEQLKDDENLINEQRKRYQSELQAIKLHTLVDITALLSNTYKNNDVYSNDNGLYGLDTCPLQFLYRIFKGKSYIEMLQLFDQSHRDSYLNVVQAHIDFLKRKKTQYEGDRKWVEDNKTTIGKPNSLLKHYDSELRKIDSLAMFLSDQQSLLRNTYSYKGQSLGIRTCPMEKLIDMFPRRRVLRQFLLLDPTLRQSYQDCFNNILKSLNQLRKSFEDINTFLFEMLLRTHDVPRIELLIDQLRPIITGILINEDHEMSKKREIAQNYLNEVNRLLGQENTISDKQPIFWRNSQARAMSIMLHDTFAINEENSGEKEVGLLPM